MTATRTTHRSPDQLKTEAEALHATLTEKVDHLRRSDQWVAFLKFAQSFHSYSLNNVLLILSQRPDATQVAGFRAWQRNGRQVRKGEHGIRIFGYSTVVIASDGDNTSDDGELTVRRVPRYPLVTVFDITQTDPIDAASLPADPARLLMGADDHGIINTLTAHLAEQGWTVSRETIRGGANGYADPSARRVVIRTDLPAEHTAKTLIHETAHITLGHTDDLAGYDQHRGLAETEAESVAYIVAGLIGFDTSAYSISYITGWSDGDTTLIKSTAARVLAAAHTITTILEPDTDAES